MMWTYLHLHSWNYTLTILCGTHAQPSEDSQRFQSQSPLIIIKEVNLHGTFLHSSEYSHDTFALQCIFLEQADKKKKKSVSVTSNMDKYQAVYYFSEISFAGHRSHFDYTSPSPHIGNALFVTKCVSVCVCIDHFYIVLFSALEQTRCAHMWFYMS